jgi:hypothetical protein
MDSYPSEYQYFTGFGDGYGGASTSYCDFQTIAVASKIPMPWTYGSGMVKS